MKSDQSSDNGANTDPNGNHPRQPTPQFLAGNRQVSMAALREQIEVQFIEETGERSDIFVNADEKARRELIHDMVDYVLATSSISLSRADKLVLLDTAYHDLFGLGSLDSFLADEQVTELTIDGPEQVYVRYNAEDMRAIETPFENSAMLERAVQRVLLATTGAQVTESEPVLEVGAMLGKRPARLTIIAPPLSPLLHVNIRLHAAKAVTLKKCVDAGLLNAPAATMLRAIIAAGHALKLVGDVGTGKTTLLEALLPILPQERIVVERARELHVPAYSSRFDTIPSCSEHVPIDF